MSTLDQAFIRAYQASSARKQADAAAPPANAATAGTPSAAAPAAPNTGSTVRRYFVDTAHSTEYVPHYGDAPTTKSPAAATADIELLSARLAQVNAANTASTPIVDTPPTVAPEPSLHAAYETQRFAWPRKLEVLIAAAGGDFAEFAGELDERSREGRKSLLVTSAERGAGRSLVALALARLVANRNLRTVVVDLDFKQPSLGELLGLRPELGWDDACSERLTLGDVLVESREDRLTLLPLRCGFANPRSLSGNRFLSDALAELREHFDYIVLDAGPLADDAVTVDLATAVGGHSFDDGLVVRDRRRTTPSQVHDVARRLAALGIRRWDLAENFAEIQGY